MRLPQLTLDEMNTAQKQVHASITNGERGRVGGPFLPLMYSPDMTGHIEQLGAYIRYQSAVPVRQRELVICIVGTHWQADFEWHTHAPLALEQGISQNTLDHIAQGHPVTFDDEKDASAYAFATDLLQTKRVSEPVYANALDLFGEQGVVDLTGLIGYYTLLAMTLNVFKVDVPSSANIPWRTA